MIIDVTDIELTPSENGADCLGNGQKGAECCCDECDYMQCCFGDAFPSACRTCEDSICPSHPLHTKK